MQTNSTSTLQLQLKAMNGGTVHVNDLKHAGQPYDQYSYIAKGIEILDKEFAQEEANANGGEHL